MPNKTMETKQKLWTVVLQVRPEPAHPRYFEIQFGYLFVWLFDSSPYAAADRAAAIVKQLPYELANSKTLVRPAIEENVLYAKAWTHATEACRPGDFLAARAVAEANGFALLFIPIKTGAPDPFPLDWTKWMEGARFPGSNRSYSTVRSARPASMTRSIGTPWKPRPAADPVPTRR